MTVCDSTWIGGFDVALSCVREDGHPMPHRDDCGTTWDDRPAPSAITQSRRTVVVTTTHSTPTVTEVRRAWLLAASLVAALAVVGLVERAGW